VKEEFTRLLAYFRFGNITATEMILMVDNLFVPGDQMINKPEKLKKTYFIPNFCGNKVPNQDSVLVLWDLQAPAPKREGEERKRPRAEIADGEKGKTVQNRRGIRARQSQQQGA